MKPVFLALSLAVAAPVPFFTGAAAVETCIADWSIAARIVRKEGLTSVDKIAEFAREKGVGPIVRTMLCEANGSFVYKLITREPEGQVNTFTVDAREPFVR
jgi:hypothetical protein